VDIMTDNNIKEDEVHQLSDIKNTIYNKNVSCANISNINNDNDNNNTQSEKASWWLNKLDSLGIKKVIMIKMNQITFKTLRICLIIKSKNLF
jgi:hypothetical protein